MKNISKIIGASIVAVLFLSGMGGVSACQLDTELIAGQDWDNPVGNVHVNHPTSHSQFMYVTYSTYDEWVLNEMHLAVATSFEGIPQTNPGDPDKVHNPKVGNFEYSSEPSPPVTSFTFTIDLSKYIDPQPDGRYLGILYLAAHAVVHHPELGGETAWADTYGIPFNPQDGPGNGNGPGNWALYFIVELT